MRITSAARTRVFFGALLALCAAASASSCGASSSTDAGVAGAAGAAGSSDAVTWCAAYQVVNCVCQQCHQSPPLNGAPIPLLTYADTQAPFPDKTSDKKVWQEMQLDVSTGAMPYTGDKTIMPLVKPLTEDQKSTLLTWLAQGAHDEGGQDCPNTCDWSGK